MKGFRKWLVSLFLRSNALETFSIGKFFWGEKAIEEKETPTARFYWNFLEWNTITRGSKEDKKRSYREFSQSNSLALKEGLNLSICDFDMSLKQHRQEEKRASFLKMKLFLCFQMHQSTSAEISINKLWPKAPLATWIIGKKSRS
jgi:hypothetical protein